MKNNRQPKINKKNQIEWNKSKLDFEKSSYIEKLIFWRKNNYFNSNTPLVHFNPDCKTVDKEYSNNFISIFPKDGYKTNSDMYDIQNAVQVDSEIALLVNCLIEIHSESFKQSSNLVFEKISNKKTAIEFEIQRIQKLVDNNECVKLGYDLGKNYSDEVTDIPKGWLFFIFQFPIGKLNFNNFCDGFQYEKFQTSLYDRLHELTTPNQSAKQIFIKANKIETNNHPNNFGELFYDADLVNPCIDVLRKVNPPLININCNYIGKSKGAFCVWFDEMKRQGIIKHYSDRKVYASLLSKKLGNFSIDESMFGKTQKRAEQKYLIDFKTLLSQIKLSHNSQKGKLRK